VKSLIRAPLVAALGLGLAGVALFGAARRQAPARTPPHDLQFIFTADQHYGITRPAFQGHTNVDSHVVNAAMVRQINSLPALDFPDDGGLRAGERIGAIDFVIDGGDIANREETTESGQIQDAAASWAQYRTDYIDGLTLTDPDGHRVPLYVVPGNHDVSNAVGFYQPMVPKTDDSSMVAIYNLMMRPKVPLTDATYRYWSDRIATSRDIAGIHFVFLTVWPDSQMRRWMDRDLADVSPSTPVIIVTHDPPDGESNQFTNPNGSHDISAHDRFENLLSDTFADGTTAGVPDIIERRALERFFDRHPNITAYFHGHANWNEFYDWTGPDHTAHIHTFRVDSPMKGRISRKDETKLSFQVVTLDPATRTMTVRECLWDADRAHPRAPVKWGASTTVVLTPAPTPEPPRH
jgi:Calcineurin-like phosphoesterase